MTKGARTPWGEAQHEREIAPGITEFETASHGGIRLSPERYKEMPEPYRSIKPFAGRGWYEEDCDWALVALAWPDEYCTGLAEDQKALILKGAQKTYDTYHAPKLEAG